MECCSYRRDSETPFSRICSHADLGFSGNFHAKLNLGSGAFWLRKSVLIAVAKLMLVNASIASVQCKAIHNVCGSAYPWVKIA